MKKVNELAHFWNGVRDVMGMAPLYQDNRSHGPRKDTDMARFYRVYAEVVYPGMKPKSEVG